MSLTAPSLRQQWLGNVKNDLLSGTVVALALIPEAIAFSIIAGVDPKIGLYASFTMAVTSAIFGGRPAMISAATGAMALVLVSLVKAHGLQYMLAAGLLTGLLQLLFSFLKLGRYMRFVPHSVMTGFVNALAILIFMAQLPQFTGATWHVYAIVAAGLAIIYTLPRLTKAVPSPLVAILVLTIVSVSAGLPVRTVGDMGQLPTALPTFALPHVPLTLDTLLIIAPYSLTLALVGLLESLLTAAIVDDFTHTPSDKNREALGQGLSNLVTGCFGGMAGCAMIGQSVINVKSGGRGRLSTLAAGVLLLFFIVVLGPWVGRIPMGALVAVMFMVSLGTFDWRSLRRLHIMPRGEAGVMVLTVATVVLTHDLGKGVIVGVLLSALLFARKVAKLISVTPPSQDPVDGVLTYRVTGQLFFASTTDFLASFHPPAPAPKTVRVDLTHAHVWDASAVAALDKLVLRFRRHGTAVELVGLNEPSAALHAQLATHHDPNAPAPAHSPPPPPDVRELLPITRATTTIARATVTVARANLTAARATATAARATATVARATTTVARATATVAWATATVARAKAGNDEGKMTNDGATTHNQRPLPNERPPTLSFGHSDLIRHSGFVIRVSLQSPSP